VNENLVGHHQVYVATKYCIFCTVNAFTGLSMKTFNALALRQVNLPFTCQSKKVCLRKKGKSCHWGSTFSKGTRT